MFQKYFLNLNPQKLFIFCLKYILFFVKCFRFTLYITFKKL